MELIIVWSPGLHSRYHIVLNFPTLSSNLTYYPFFIPILLDRSSFGYAWSFPTSMNLHRHWLLLGILIFCIYQTPMYPSLKPSSNRTPSKTVLSNMLANSCMRLFTFKFKWIKLKIQFFSLSSHISVLNSHILLNSATLRSLLSSPFSN